MNKILRDMINEGKVAAFVNDVLVGTEMEKGHDEVVEEVLRRLEENDFYVKPEKYVWKVKKVLFLGVVMEEGKVEMEEDKVEGVLKWLAPQCVRDIRKFLGLANYYRRFVKDFAKVALPMNKLTRKDKRWKWGDVRATRHTNRDFRKILREQDYHDSELNPKLSSTFKGLFIMTILDFPGLSAIDQQWLDLLWVLATSRK